MSKVEAYKDHRAGSAKGKCHKVWDDTKDVDKVVAKAVALGKAETTGRTWASEFKNPPGKVAKKKAVKKAVKRERPAKVAKPKKSAKKAAAKPAVKREKLPAEARA